MIKNAMTGWKKPMEKYDVLIIGSGPAGLFAAMELERRGLKRIGIIDRETYPAGGLLNDGKLNFHRRIGIDTAELGLDDTRADALIGEVKEILTAVPGCRQVTFPGTDMILAWERIAWERNVDFIAPEQWHWGTDNGRRVVDHLRNRLKSTAFLLGREVHSIQIGPDSIILECGREKDSCPLECSVLLAAPGRKGAYWFRSEARRIDIDTAFGPIDVGIRVELNRKFFDTLTDTVYDPKFLIRTNRHRDRVRTFCTNPGGRVRFEHYGEFKIMNGDALAGQKTSNTNFALLNTIRLTEPFSDTTMFGQMIAKQFHLLGDGAPIVQRVGDFREGKRSRKETFLSERHHFHVCEPSCTAVPGDITLGMPARIVDNLWESLKTLDKIVPGILHPSTLLYAPEIKFFDTNYPTDEQLETNIGHIFVAGDGAGKSRGIVGAAVTGILAARGMLAKHF